MFGSDMLRCRHNKLCFFECAIIELRMWNPLGASCSDLVDWSSALLMKTESLVTLDKSSQSCDCLPNILVHLGTSWHKELCLRHPNGAVSPIRWLLPLWDLVSSSAKLTLVPREGKWPPDQGQVSACAPATVPPVASVAQYVTSM